MIDSQPPTPKDPWDVQRWDRTRLRRRMLTGLWRADLLARTRRALGVQRADAVQDVDISSNPFASVCSEMAVLYDVPATVLHDDEAAARRMQELLDRAGWPAIAQEVQRLTLGLREMLVHVSAMEIDGEIEVTLRPVFPDVVVATPDRQRPHFARRVEEARQVVDSKGRTVWAWEVCDVGTLNAEGKRVGALHEVVEAIEGSPKIADFGAPPAQVYVFYHAEFGSTLWNPDGWQELVDGTLEIGVDRSAAHYALRMAAHEQRYMINCQPAAVEQAGTGATQRHEVATDPSTVVILEPIDPQQPASAGSWAPSFDPRSFQEAVSASEQTLALLAGIPAADVLRVNSDSRSGVALQISAEGKRAVARRFMPTFRRSDIALLEAVAAVVNEVATEDQRLPTRGWNVRHNALPPTADEQAKVQASVTDLLTRGLISEVEARSRLTGESLDQARVKIDEVIAERMRGSVALTVGAQAQIDLVLAAVERGDRTAETARPILISVLGMRADAADEALRGVKPRTVVNTQTGGPAAA